MIQQVLGYLVGDKLFASLAEAQKAELEALLSDGGVLGDAGLATVNAVVKHADEVIAILSGKPRTKKPRSDKGKKRAAKEKAAVP